MRRRNFSTITEAVSLFIGGQQQINKLYAKQDNNSYRNSNLTKMQYLKSLRSKINKKLTNKRLGKDIKEANHSSIDVHYPHNYSKIKHKFPYITTKNKIDYSNISLKNFRRNIAIRKLLKSSKKMKTFTSMIALKEKLSLSNRAPGMNIQSINKQSSIFSNSVRNNNKI